MDLRSNPLRIQVDDEVMVAQIRLDNADSLLSGNPVSLLVIERQRPESVSLESFCGCQDLNWRIVTRSKWRFVAMGWCDDHGLEVEVELVRDEAGLWSCHVTLVNRNPCPVSAVSFMPLSSIPLTACSHLQLAIPHCAGCLVPASKLSQGQRITLNYPVQASMQWADLVFGDVGIYLACHDQNALFKQLIIQRRTYDLSVSWRYSDLNMRQDERLALPPFVIGGHHDGWWGGARYYRGWAEGWMRDPDVPEWFARCPSWLWFGLKSQYADRPRRRYSDIPGRARDMVSAGMPVLQLCQWMKNGHDTNYPDFEAGDDMGGEGALRSALEAVRNDGRRTSLYVNTRLIDPDSRFAANNGWQASSVTLPPSARAQAEAASGTFTGQAVSPDQVCERGKRSTEWDPRQDLAKEQYGQVVFAVACPSSPRWREHYLERIRRLVEAYRPDGFFLDQVCGCASLPCYAGGHDHDRPARAWAGLLRLLPAIREVVRAECPECYLASEGVSDVFGQYIDVLQAHNDWTDCSLPIGISLPELFRVSFPRRVLLCGPVIPDDDRYLRLGHLIGAGFDLSEKLFDAASPGFREFVDRLLTLRRKLDPYIRGAEPYRRVTSPAAGLRTFGLYRQAQGGPATLLVNGAWLPPDGPADPPEEFVVQVGLDQPVIEATLYNESLDQTRIQPADRDGYVSFTVPATRIFSLLLRCATN